MSDSLSNTPEGAQFFLTKCRYTKKPRYYKVNEDGVVMQYRIKWGKWVTSSLNDSPLEEVMDYFTNFLKPVE